MLETIWFILWGVLWAVYLCLDGYDLGMGMLMPFLAKDDLDKRRIYNAAGPFWDGNEVWLITAGGVTFAAFPRTYAIMFSGLYTALMLLLFALILRGVTFEFRSKIESPRWRGFFDTLHVVGSFLPALLLGVAFANIFKGLPIDADGVTQGTILDLLNPYGLAGGVLFVLLLGVHGSIWLAIKTTGPIHERALDMAERLWMWLAFVVVLFLALTAVYTKVYANYLAYPLLFVFPLLAAGGLVMNRAFLGQRRLWMALGASAATIVGAAAFGLAGIFPALLPSSLNPAWSSTITNSASSPLTLKIMLGVAGVMVPIVIAYQVWMHLTFSHKLTDEDLEHDEAY
jgi:cytochrome d ubiquinol oxidase subunit II